MTDDDPIIERRPPDEVARIAADQCSPETRRAAVEWLIRAGLGSVFLAQHPDLDPPAEDVGALFAITFDPGADPLHDDLYRQLQDIRYDTDPENTDDA